MVTNELSLPPQHIVYSSSSADAPESNPFRSLLAVRASPEDRFQIIADSRNDLSFDNNRTFFANDRDFLAKHFHELSRHLGELKKSARLNERPYEPTVQLITSSGETTPTAAQLIIATILVQNQLIENSRTDAGHFQVYNGATDGGMTPMEWVSVPPVKERLPEAVQKAFFGGMPHERKLLGDIPHSVARIFEESFRSFGYRKPSAVVVLNNKVISKGMDGRNLHDPLSTAEVVALTAPEVNALTREFQSAIKPGSENAVLYTLTLNSGPLAEQAAAGIVSRIINVEMSLPYNSSYNDHQRFATARDEHARRHAGEIVGWGNPDLRQIVAGGYTAEEARYAAVKVMRPAGMEIRQAGVLQDTALRC